MTETVPKKQTQPVHLRTQMIGFEAYYCLPDVAARPSISTYDVSKVTCKNCLKRMRKYNV